MTNKIDWNSVNKESERCLKICASLDKEIAEKWKVLSDDTDLEKQTEMVNKFINKYNLDSATLEIK